MNECAVMSGIVPADGVVGLLRAIESQRTSGELRFSTDSGLEGAVRLDAGQLAFEQEERPDGKDVVELFLALRGGRFAVLQILPVLPVSEGDATVRRGSLATHAPADLLNYAERAGLTGTLTFERDTRRACIHYDRGELVGIVVDGLDAGLDVNIVFGWSDGSFLVEARSTPVRLPDVAPGDVIPEAALPSPAPRGAAKERAGTQLLRVVEMKLGAILEEARERRPHSVPAPPMPNLMPRPRTIPPNPEAQVRVIFLGGAGEMLLRREDLVAPASDRSDDLRVAGVSRERTSTTQAARASAPTPASGRSDAERAEGIPRAAIVVIVALLVLGLAAFVATLIDLS